LDAVHGQSFCRQQLPAGKASFGRAEQGLMTVNFQSCRGLDAVSSGSAVIKLSVLIDLSEVVEQ